MSDESKQTASQLITHHPLLITLLASAAAKQKAEDETRSG